MRTKPIDFEESTFAGLKNDMTVSLNIMLGNMIRYGADEATMNVKLKVQLHPDQHGNTVPIFAHSISSAVHIKDECKGSMGGDYALERGMDGRRFVLQSIGQVTLDDLESMDDDLTQNVDE